MIRKYKTAEMILCTFLCIIILSVSWKVSATRETAGGKVDVVIDAGHGLPDGGAVGKSGVKESKINLAVATYLRNELEKNGIKTIMTREDENALYSNENDSIRNKKSGGMRKRIDIINGSGAKIAISIHMNYFGIKKYSGPQLFCQSDCEKSYILSGCIKKSLYDNIGEHCTREIKKVDGGIYLLKNAEIPIVLAECGFLSNEEEEKLLITDEYCKKMGTAIAEGIINYLKSKS